MKFRYEAKTRGGESARGEIEAADERTAASQLREKGLTPIEITPRAKNAARRKFHFPRSLRAA